MRESSPCIRASCIAERAVLIAFANSPFSAYAAARVRNTRVFVPPTSRSACFASSTAFGPFRSDASWDVASSHARLVSVGIEFGASSSAFW